MKNVLNKALSFILPGFGDILWVAVFAGVIGIGPRMMNIDGDLGRHLTIGRYILEQGQIPKTDLFSHTMTGMPLTPHEWLAQVIFALANQVMGLDGVVVACALVITTSFWLVFRRSRESSQSLLSSVLVSVLAIAASSLHWLSRPHIFTFLMLALWINVLDDLRAGRLWRWWLLPLIMLFWANLHGAFIAGFVTWGLYGLGLAWDAIFHRFPKGEVLHGHFWRYFFLGGAASLLISLANPSGIGLWGTSLGFLGSRYLVSHTAEYLPPNFQDPSTWPFLMMIGLLVVLFGLQSKRLEAARVLPAAGWLVMGLYSVRNVPLFAIVAAPVLAVALGDWLCGQPKAARIVARLHELDQRLLRTDLMLRGLVWPVVALVFCIVALRAGTNLDFQGRGNIFDPQVFPVQAVNWLGEHPQQGNMFNQFPWGGYLLYRLWPEQRVFIDGQTDFYGEKLTRQYEQVITTAPGWESALASYHVQWAIVPPDGPLAKALNNQAGWKQIYQDGTAVIFSRLAGQ